MITMLEAIRRDCVVLLERALLHNQLVMFGEDGCGQHGRAEFPVYSEVTAISVNLTADDNDDPSDIHGIVILHMPDYDAGRQGHAMTDQNLRISLNRCLDAAAIDRAAIDWADISLQGQQAVVLSIDVSLLMDWV